MFSVEASYLIATAIRLRGLKDCHLCQVWTVFLKVGLVGHDTLSCPGPPYLGPQSKGKSDHRYLWTIKNGQFPRSKRKVLRTDGEGGGGRYCPSPAGLFGQKPHLPKNPVKIRGCWAKPARPEQPLALSLLPLSQPDPWAATVLLDELYAGRF
jgi:hypothetical protein